MERVEMQLGAIKLFAHNQIAYEAALAQLEETGKAAVIHPTGTGKSFIAFALAHEHPRCRVCWLSPSEYMFSTQCENLRRATQIDVPENITFYTYAKLMGLDEEALEAIDADYIVLDEFHRCGATEWGRGVERLLERSPQAGVLGLSATSIRYLDRQRDMADELFDGCVASSMTLGEAITRGILPAPKYVLSLYSMNKELERYKRRIVRAKQPATRKAAEKLLEALRRAVSRAQGLHEIFAKHLPDKHGKYIVFCSDREHLDEVKERVAQWFHKVDAQPHIYSVYAEANDAKRAFEGFKTDESEHLKLLLCIDMLNEGVHIKGVSGVILLRPTLSPIIYKQQVGRALSAASSDVPVIFDIVNNVENLYSIGAVQEEMQEIVTFYRHMGGAEEIVHEGFEIVDEVRECRALFDQLEATLCASWELMFAEAKRYFVQNGDLDVPKHYRTDTNLSLGAWITTQRRIRRGNHAGVLSEERIAQLDAIGMIWENKQELHWERCFERAQHYAQTHGDLDVPVTYRTEDGFALGRWVARMRQLKANGAGAQMTPERAARLDTLGMIWDRVSYAWEKHYLAAMQYYLSHGDLDVPVLYCCADGFKLGVWVQQLRMRAEGERGGLTPEQRARLERIGMVWKPRHDAQWERCYREAERYARTHGDLNVPAAWESGGVRLGRWLYTQRKAKHEGRLSKERCDRLSALGMIWKRAEGWEAQYERAQAYYRAHGDLEMTADYRTEDGAWLGRWIYQQRKAYAANELTAGQIGHLEQIGMRWGSKSALLWQAHYAQAKAYWTEHGDLNVPADYCTQSGLLLRVWLNRQRKAATAGTLTQAQRHALEAIGLLSDGDPWSESYAQAKHFYTQSGHLNVPSDQQLGRWLNRQRKLYQAGELRDEQVKRLEAIGIDWLPPNQRAWENGYEAARRYCVRTGALSVAAKYVDAQGYPLGEWLTTQRKRKRAGKLSPEQEARLNALDVTWAKPPQTTMRPNHRLNVATLRQAGNA